MATYQVETESGAVYEIETESGAAPEASTAPSVNPLVAASSGFLSGLSDVASAVDVAGRLLNPIEAGRTIRGFFGDKDPMARPLVGESLKGGIDALVSAMGGPEGATSLGQGSIARRAGELAPSFLVPMGATGGIAKEAAKAGVLATSSALGGALGEEEGGATGRLIGELAAPIGVQALASGAKAAGRKFGELAQGTKESLYGVTGLDVRKSLERAPRMPGDEAQITKALDDLIQQKAIVPGEPAANRAALELQNQQLGKQIGEALGQAAKVQDEPLQITFTKARDYVKNQLPSADQAAALSVVDDLERAANEKNILISEWAREQKALADAGAASLGREGVDDIATNIKKFAAVDVRQAVDRELSKPIYREAFGEGVTSIKQLRDEMAKRYAVLPALIRAEAREAGKGLNEEAISLWRTTQGYGVPTLIGMAAGGVPGAVAGAATGAAIRSVPGRMATQKTLEILGPAFESTGRGLSMTLPEVLGRSALTATMQEEPTDLGTLGIRPELDREPESLPIIEPPKQEKESPATNIRDLEAFIDSDPYLAAVYATESSRNPKAKNPESSASGAFQLIDAIAKALGVKDPFDLQQNLQGMLKLTEENAASLGTRDPVILYAAHYMGAPLAKKVINNERLSSKETKIKNDFFSKALPRFRQQWAALQTGQNSMG